jgi:Protein of unknown function (DUF1579)
MSVAPPENTRLGALIGTWHTEGEILAEDGRATAGVIDGTDAYEWLGGFFVIHRIDVRMGADRVEGLEIIGPYDPETGTYPTRAYDNQGGIQTSTATGDDDGVWTFGADGAKATLRIADNGESMRVEWVRLAEDGLPAVVQPIDVLQKSGLVASEKVGRVRTCRLEPLLCGRSSCGSPSTAWPGRAAWTGSATS